MIKGQSVGDFAVAVVSYEFDREVSMTYSCCQTQEDERKVLEFKAVKAAVDIGAVVRSIFIWS